MPLGTTGGFGNMRPWADHPRQFSVNRILVLGLSSIVILVLLLTLGLLFVMQYDTAREDEIREIYFPQLIRAKEMRSTVADQQVSLRGLIITGDTRFLDSFYAGREHYLHTVSAIHEDAHINANTVDLLQQQLVIVERWYEEVAIPEAEAAQAGTLTAAQQREILADSTARLDEFVALNLAYQQAILDQIDETTAQLNQLRNGIQVAAIIGGLLVLSVTAYMSLRIIRMIRTPLGDLMQVVSAVDAGETDRRIPSLSAVEFDQLGQGVNRMLDSLERKVEEAEVQRSRVATIVDSANDGIVVIDADGVVTNINPAAARLFDTSVETALQRSAADLGLFSEDEVRASTRRSRGSATQPVVRRRGERVLSATISTLPSDDEQDDRPGVVWVLRDVTELARIDEMKNEFISIVSHELRTPLTAIKGFTDLILEGEVGEISESQREFLEIVQSNSDRLVALINDMLDISRIESGRIVLSLDDVHVASIVERTLTTLRPVFSEKGLNLQTEIDEELAPVVADEARLLQVLTNLISNACKYTPNGGWVTIRAEALDSQVAISVSDTGIGIPPDALPQVFSKFYRVDQAAREVGGTGLGLAITKSLVEMHGGRINIASRVGVGTTVRFTLPTTAAREAGSNGGQQIDRSRPLVMVVTRDDEFRERISRQLHGLAVQVDYPRSLSAPGVVADAELLHPAVLIVAATARGEPNDDFCSELLEELGAHDELATIPVVLVRVGLALSSELPNVTVLDADAPDEDISLAVQSWLPESSPTRSMRGRILVAEDDTDIGAWLRRVLVAQGYDVTLVHDGLAAVVRAIEVLPDALILDANMPKMGANEVLPQLRSNPGTSDIPIIVMSGTIPDAGPYFIEAGATDFIAKPFDIEVLLAQLAELLRRPADG
jgi:PAS domain S-box-containing protein